MLRVFDAMYRSGVVPVVTLKDPKIAIDVANAVIRGGIKVLEIAMRTPEAAECIHTVHECCPEIIVGAGTVIKEEQAVAAHEAGAEFGVAPGYDGNVIACSQRMGMPFIPGTVHSTDVQKAVLAGVRLIKFFPSEPFGGLTTIDFLAEPFSMVKFLPAGGVDLHNLEEYLFNPAVFACAGGFMAPAAMIEQHDWNGITDICKTAHAVAQKRVDRLGIPEF